MKRFCRSLAITLAFAATGSAGGCYAGYGGQAGYGGYTRSGGYSGSSCHYRGGAGSFSGGWEEFVLFAGFYGGVALIAAVAELTDRCIDYCSD